MAKRSPNFPTDDPKLFARAVNLLQDYAGHGGAVRTNNFAVAIAVLMHRQVPGARRKGPEARVYPPGTGKPISTGTLQAEVCDKTFLKYDSFLQNNAQGPIYKLFSSSFKPVSSSKNNNWRNSFDLQTGLGCDAPYDSVFLRSPEYLAEDRLECVYRDSSSGKCTSPFGFQSGNRSCFMPAKKGKAPGGDSTASKCPKLLARVKAKSGEKGYQIVEPTPEVLRDLLHDPSNRVPLFPFLVSLYAGSPYFAAWSKVANRKRLQADLMLDSTRFLTLFDPRTENPYNKALLGRPGPGKVPVPAKLGVHKKPFMAKTQEAPLKSVPFRAGRDPKKMKLRADAAGDPAERLRLLERANKRHAKTLDSLGSQLKGGGLSPLEQPRGYDLYVEADKVGHLFEVKTWRPGNLRSQVLAGLAQLYEYRWRNRSSMAGTVQLYLVLDQKPPKNEHSWIRGFLFEDRGVLPCWIEKARLVTFPKYGSRIAWIP